MADARAVYEQFLLTPLKLKARRAAADVDAASADEERALAAALPFELVTETDEDEPARRDTRAAAAELQASPEVERLRGRIESADLTDAVAGDATARSAPTAAAGDARRGRKKKRAARTVVMANASTGGTWADTPTKASRPSKRSRCVQPSSTADLDKENRGGVEEAVLDSVARRIADSFTESEEHDDAGMKHPDGANDSATTASTSSSSPPPATDPPRVRRRNGGKAAQTNAKQSVRRSRRLANQSSDQEDSSVLPSSPPPVDHLTPLCDALVATNTISGLVFALSLNALRFRALVNVCGIVNPYDTAFKICYAIAQCEQLTQQQHKLPTVQLSPKRRHSGSARALEQLIRTTPKAKDGVQSQPTKKKKKSVSFRSFDFSCLNLQYVGNERVAAMVDRMIVSYGSLMEYVSSTLQQQESSDSSPPSPTLQILQELSVVMADESLLLLTASTVNLKYQSEREASDSSRILETAFSARDSSIQHEIRLASEYFAHQFKLLVDSSSSESTPSAFLHEMFSALISSTIRYKLRVIFLHSTHKEDGDEMKETENEKDEVDLSSPAALAAATYTHQDVGAAIHRALQESLLYLPLVTPLLDVLDQTDLEDQVAALSEKLMEYPGEDVERIDQFILARRFLQYHISHTLGPSDGAGEVIADIWREIERVCSIAKRYQFEDEAHLFPLASVQALKDTLDKEATNLEFLDKAVQCFWERQEGYGNSGVNSLQECAECHAVITRAEAPVSIACTLCSSRFHLKCLHLPDSFAQFAAHYTCPACFLGRSRMEY